MFTAPPISPDLEALVSEITGSLIERFSIELSFLPIFEYLETRLTAISRAIKMKIEKVTGLQ